MLTFKNTFVAALIATAAASANFTTAQASDEFCGYWAFAGAFQNPGNAHRRAIATAVQFSILTAPTAQTQDRDITLLPKVRISSKSRANRRAREYRQDGVRGAYAAHRCFYVSYNN